MTASTRLVTSGIRKAYAAPVLVDVNFSLAAGEVHALVGENGAGKSTLCRILCGFAAADGGTMTLEGTPYAPRDKNDAEAHGVRMVRQELGVIGTLSIAENIYLADLPARAGWIDRKRLRAEAARVMALVGLGDLDPETPAGTLGVGQQQAIEIAAALTRPCRVLILDEPTAALTGRETELLFEQIRALKAAGTSVIYISHRLEELAVIADRVTVLRDGALVATMAMKDATTDEIVRAMVGRDLQVDEAHATGDAARVAGNPVTLRVRGLRAGAAVREVSFEARKGEILGFAGLMGSGRSETMRALFGADARDAGEIAVGEGAKSVPLRGPGDAVRLGLAFITENRKEEGLLLPLSIRVNTTLGKLRTMASRAGFIRGADESSATLNLLRALAVRSAGPEQPVGELSGGNQQKIVIAKWLLNEPSILIFDEPTRGIDIGARREIYRIMRELAAAGKTLLVVSSDMKELFHLCDRIAVMSRGKLVTTFDRKDATQEGVMTAAISEYLGAPAVSSVHGRHA